MKKIKINIIKKIRPVKVEVDKKEGMSYEFY